MCRISVQRTGSDYAVCSFIEKEKYFMTQKRKPPWGMFLIGLVLVLIVSYYAAGLFSLEGVTIQNYQDKLTYILLHPFRNWLNSKTSAVMGIALVAWAMFVCYYLTYYRNFHPDAEHGVAEWADVAKTAKKLYGKGEEPVTLLSKNIKVNAKALPNMHILILGGSGDGKTTSLLIPNILLANMTNIILDVKGDLLKNYGGYLKEKGVTVKSLNFKDMLQSDQYNPFVYIDNYTDMVELITNIQTSVKPPDAQKGDPFWDDGVGLYLQSL